MSKVVVKFIKGWGKYNAKDIAGFDKKVATDLIEVKKVATLHNGGAVKVTTVKLEVGTKEVDKVIAEAEAQFQQKADELEQASSALDDRSDDLDAKSDALDKREADLVKREKAVKTSGMKKSVVAEPPVEGNTKEPGAAGNPPKQGSK